MAEKLELLGMPCALPPSSAPLPSSKLLLSLHSDASCPYTLSGALSSVPFSPSRHLSHAGRLQPLSSIHPSVVPGIFPKHV